jgi:integrase
MLDGVVGRNHFLRATAATRLFEAGVDDYDEHLIMQRTGHSITAGVRSYKRVHGREIKVDRIRCPELC